MNGLPMGGAVTGYSPDGSRQYRLIMPAVFAVTNQGNAAVPAGATFTVSYDARLVSDLYVEIDDTQVTPSGSRTEGNVTSVSFSVAREIPVGANIYTNPQFTWVDPLPWFTDVEPVTVAITPPAELSDVFDGNNSVVMEASYSDTDDAAVSAT